MSDQPAPAVTRAFVSYSWSSPTHESWVLSLASRLREDGVDIILDKWDLKPGHNAYTFMESMVTDSSVTKVMMICDKTYVEKANNRSGGVGTESQIISPELYKNSTQDKFAALMTDQDDQGEAHIPVFYKGRIYFDFRSADRFEESYEQLLRWLVDRPLYVKPKLGALPEGILQAAPAATPTQSRARRAEEAIRQGSTSALGFLREYGEALQEELKALAPEGKKEPFDEAVLEAVSAMRPYLRQLGGVVLTTVRFSQDSRVWEGVLAIHESLGRLMYRSPDRTSWHSHEFDAFKIVAHEAFLSTIATALDEERFDLAAAALRRPYFVRENDGADRRSTSDFSVFNQQIQSLEHRKQRLKLNRISLHADLLKEAHPPGSVPSFISLMQADFVLFLRSAKQEQGRWYPFSLVYAADRYTPFPVFARAESRGYFDRIAPMLNVANLAEFGSVIAEINDSGRSSRMFDHHGLPVKFLANADHVGAVE